MPRSVTPSVVTPRTVAAIVGGACLIALVEAVVDAGGTIPAAGSTAITWRYGIVLGVLGLFALGAGVALRLSRTSPDVEPRRQALIVDESEIRTVLERWYPDWHDADRRKVAAAISYHRRRGQGDPYD